MQQIDSRFLDQPITSNPGEPFHRLFALLCDTVYGDIPENVIAELESRVEQRRWRNANNETVDTASTEASS